LAALQDFGFDVPSRSISQSSIGSLAIFSPEILAQIFGWLPSFGEYLDLKAVSKEMYDIVADSQFTSSVVREMLQPDPSRGLFWAYPIEEHPSEQEDFIEALKTWVLSSDKSAAMALNRKFILSSEFPLLHFVRSMCTEDNPRNRRRLWKNAQRLREVWVDYRMNGWKVNKFGVSDRHSLASST
jgi:hypothetical protein